LFADETIYVLKGDGTRLSIPHRCHEEVEIAAIILPGMGAWTSSANPIDETLDFD
jgi:hypothetical protein